MGTGKRDDGKTAWQAKREASYQTLIRSAMYRFYERGYMATRVDDIVAGTGYTSGAFYFHFKNKADCFWQVIDYRQQRRSGWTTFLDDLAPATVDLETVIRRALASLSPDVALSGWSLVMVEHFQAHRDDHSVAQRYQELFRTWHDDQIAFVQRLQHQGWVAPTRDAGTIALQLLSFVGGLAMHAIVFGIDRAEVQRTQLDGILRILSS